MSALRCDQFRYPRSYRQINILIFCRLVTHPDRKTRQSEARIAPSPTFRVVRGYKGSPHTYQVFFDRDRICFIRIGGGPGADVALAAHGGLVGALLSIWFSSRRKKKMETTARENEAKTLGRMLAEHKASHSIIIADVSDVSLEPGNWAMKKGTVLWKFQLRGEKKLSMCTFRAPEDTDAAMTALPRIFPNLRIEVAKDNKSGKYLKKPK